MTFVAFITPGNITDSMIDRICRAHGQSPKDVLSHNRARKLVKPRCEVAAEERTQLLVQGVKLAEALLQPPLLLPKAAT